jgi:hypothetical protein
MEEAKAAAYYDELNRKGEGARRFKQGLGFSSSSDPASFPSKPAGSSFLSGFVRAGAAPSPAQPPIPAKSLLPPERPSSPRRRSRSPPRAWSRSPSRSSRRRSRSRSRSRERRRRSRSREREREREDRRTSRRRSRSRSRSPSRRSRRSSHSESRRERDRHGDRRHDYGGVRERSKGRSGCDGGKVDYSRLIEGYDRMVRLTLLLLLREMPVVIRLCC